MAGLLDSGFLSSPDAQLGLGLLAMSGGNLGSAIGGLLQQQAAAEDRKIKQAYIRSQIAENESQAQSRQQQMAQAKGLNDLIASRLGRGGAGGQMQATQGGMGGGQGMGVGALQGGQAQSGGFPFTMDDILAIQAAKGPDFLPAYKFAKEGVKLEAGATYRDPVTGEERMIPKLENGMVMQGGRAGFVPGYAESVAGLEGAKTGATERAKYGYDIGRARETANIGAENDLVDVNLPTGPVKLTRAAARDMSRGAPAVNTWQNLTPQLRDLIARDAAANGIQNPTTNFEGAGPGQAYGLTNAAPVAPSGPGIPLQTAAQAAADLRIAQGRADQTLAREGKVRTATENITNADRAIELLNQGPTASGIGAAVDRGARIFGVSTPGANVAAQLDIVSANMVKNVPRFEGPQSNVDVDGYKDAAGRVADRSLPIEQRISAAKEVRRYELKALAQNGGDPVRAGISSSGQAEEQQPAANRMVFDSKPPANQSNKGKLLVGPDGKRYRSNGMQWTEE